MRTDDVTVCIPSIPTRQGLLRRALGSVYRQTHPVAAVSIAHDLDHEGAWTTRNRALAGVRTTWTAFLDDDDELLPHHVEHLLRVAREREVDVAWGWFHVIGGRDPFPHYRGLAYVPSQPHIVPITYLVRTELLHAAVEVTGGFRGDEAGAWDNQDQPLMDAYHELGRGSWADEERTWNWHHHGGNTSGLPTRW